MTTEYSQTGTHQRWSSDAALREDPGCRVGARSVPAGWPAREGVLLDEWSEPCAAAMLPDVELRVWQGRGTFEPLESGGRVGVGRGIAREAWLRKGAHVLREQRSESDDPNAMPAAPSGDRSTPPNQPTGAAPVSSGKVPSIDGYEVQRQLGRGGSATVYLAREVKHDRLVAVKVLHAELTASLQAERFLREIAIIARLAHPHILPLLDSGRSGDHLYYVTPYVPGESLRGRLTQHGKLPVADAVALVTEVSAALDYAHRQGLVHRDVKPENILLADGHCLVADFGIARAMSMAVDDRLTTMGIAPGTPRYMSPEQAMGDREVDARSDIYSLACVLFELLSGEAPFTGSTLQEVVTKHQVAPIPSLRKLAPDVPLAVERALRRALSKRPEERFDSAAGFAAALTDTTGRLAFQRPTLRTRRRFVTALVVGGIVLLTGWLSARMRETPAALPALTRLMMSVGIGYAVLDTTHFVVEPIDTLPDAAAGKAAAELRVALRRWREVRVEDEARVEELVAATKGDLAPSQRLRAAATVLGAGRFVRVDATREGDSLDVTAYLHDTRTSELIATRTLRTSADARASSGLLRTLADSMLFRVGVPAERSLGAPGTNSLAARHSYFLGHRFLANGDFRLAESAFLAATQQDETYPQALIWLANVRSWFPGTDRPWDQLVSRAKAGRAALAPTDSAILDALVAMAADDFATACPNWSRLTSDFPNDFAFWYGLGNCLRRDGAVVPAPSAPFGWRFRSSRHSAVLAFERAFRLRPAVLMGFGGRSLGELQNLMFTGGAQVQAGRAADASQLDFRGYPVWIGDSLALVPLSGEQAQVGPGSDAMGEAIQRQRLRYRDVAALWKAQFPRSADAIEALAIAMEMLGDEAALDTLQRARALAVDPDDRLRIAVSDVLMRLKFSSPSNTAGLGQAQVLADSLLRSHPPGGVADPRLLAALAGLTGRATAAARYARTIDWDASLPAALARNGPALVAFSSFGGPQDSLTALERVLSGAVQSLPVSARAASQTDWLTRSAVLAFSEGRLESLPDSGSTGLVLGNVIARALAGDTAGVTDMLADVAAARRWLRPADLMMDGLLPEAAALAFIGDRQRAIKRLDATLRALRFTASRDLSFVYRTASFVRAAALRSDLAAADGDSATARLWARVVVELWSGADEFLQPMVRRMRARLR